jgi:hypothetical protein
MEGIFAALHPFKWRPKEIDWFIQEFQEQSWTPLSYVEEDGWLVRELLLLNANNWAEHGVVDVWQVSLSWSLSDSSELVIDWSMAQANPSLVGSKIWNRNATQMSANGWAHQDFGVTGVGKSSNRLFIKLGGHWESIGIFNFRESQSSNEDDFTVPSSLEAFTLWELGDIKFLVWISDISSSSDHLVVDDGDDGLDTENVRWEDESLEHIHLGSLDLVVSVLLVPESVFIEPVINLGLGVKWISEVRWSWRSNPVGWSLCAEKVVNKLLVLSLIVLLDNSEASWLSA